MQILPRQRLRQLARGALRRLVGCERGARLAESARDEIDRALNDRMYGRDYYRTGEGGRGARSGYPEYARTSSNADALAALVWTWLDVHEALDVGCAAGYVVEALTDLGIDARGVDLSDGAFDLAPAAIRSRLRTGDVRDRLAFDSGAFDVVTAFETLEHLRPGDVPAAVRELARLSRGWVVATIPSVGSNASGPAGWYEGKVRPDRLDHYRGVDDAAPPVAQEDLARDGTGLPLEGHLTIASYGWWTDRFAEAGLVRCLDTERRMHVDLARYGLSEFVCLYVLRRDSLDEPTAPVRHLDDIVALEQRRGLLEHAAPDHHIAAALQQLHRAGLRPRPGLDDT